MSTITRPAVQIPVQAPPVSIELAGPPVTLTPAGETGHRHGQACYWDLRVCAWVCG